MEEITAENIEELKIDEGIKIIDFWATWCMPCRIMAPVFKNASVFFNETHPEYSFYKNDIDAYKNLAEKFEVSSIPTVLILQDGHELGRILGVKPIETFKTQLQAILE
jgi:thioredoxin 1